MSIETAKILWAIVGVWTAGVVVTEMLWRREARRAKRPYDPWVIGWDMLILWPIALLGWAIMIVAANAWNFWDCITGESGENPYNREG